METGLLYSLNSPTTTKYAACGAYYCRGCTCPGLYMDDHEWWECHGNVYEIYRAAGPGPIRVGDFIGIYYPHRNRWFGCPYTNCRKYTCPTPTWQYGFSSLEKWFKYWGQVFMIYPCGKGLGDFIEEHDDVMLYGAWRLLGKLLYPQLR